MKKKRSSKKPQPDEENGVEEDMGTIALDRPLSPNAPQAGKSAA